MSAKTSGDNDDGVRARPHSKTKPTRTAKLTYAALLTLRLALSLTSTAYIHPDEYFQSLEPLFLHGYHTWEFTTPDPVRSMASVWLWNGISLWLSNSPRTTWRISRLVYFTLSLICDAAVYILSDRNWTLLNLYASMGSTLTFTVRTFSNCVEAAVWAACAMLVSRGEKQHGWNSFANAFILGTLVALGIFARFTFVVFTLPLGIWYALILWRNKGTTSIIAQVASSLVAFLLTATAHIVYDSAHYGHFTLTPWNALQYNRKTTNLALHGLHPRWLHVVVNAPMILSLIGCISVVLAAVRTRRKRTTLQTTCLATILTSLAILSSQPHQEPRFLLPLVVPATLLLSSRTVNTHILTIHIVQSFFTVLLFSLTHQAGVVPCLLYVNEHNGAATLLAWRTFMPPRFLAGSQVDVWDTGSQSVWNASIVHSTRSPHLLMAPTWALQAVPQDMRTTHEYSAFPHVDMDHLGETFQVYRDCMAAEADGAYWACFTRAFSLHVVRVHVDAQPQQQCQQVVT